MIIESIPVKGASTPIVKKGNLPETKLEDINQNLKRINYGGQDKLV